MNSRAVGVNNKNQILVVDDSNAFKPVSWLFDGKAKRLMPATGYFACAGINDMGQVVGTLFPEYRAVILKSGKWIQISRPGATSAGGIAVNNAGDTLYSEDLGAGDQRSYVFSNGRRVEVCRGGLATAINNKRHVVFSVHSTPRQEVAIWKDGKRTPISFQNMILHPIDINDNDEVVGYTQAPLDSATYQGHPAEPPTIKKGFYWKDGHGYYLLHCLANPKGWVLHQATSINNKGEVVGTGSYKGKAVSFIARPIK